MYIVQVKNPLRFGWKELTNTKCRFRSLDKAIALYRDIKSSPQLAGADVRIWQPAADSRVEVDA